MKYKIALIVIAVLTTFAVALGVGYRLTNKNNNSINGNTIKEEIIEEKYEEPQEVEENPVIIDEESIKKVDEEIKKQQEEVKKQEVKKGTNTKTSDSKNTTTKQNAEVKQETTKVETKKEETKVEEKPKENTLTKTVISTENVQEESSDPYKYGVVLKEIKTYTVTTYSDGSTDRKLISTKKTYDKSGFNATTNDLKSDATSLASSNKSVYQKVLENVNTYRSEVGANNIVLDDKLSVAATIRAMEMAYSGVFDASHKRPNGSSCFTVLKETGVSYFAAGENIAEGYANADAVSAGWKDSEGHYKNMISKSFSKMGVGMCSFDGTKYWVQIFTN